jgi:hypothetical protein
MATTNNSAHLSAHDEVPQPCGQPAAAGPRSPEAIDALVREGAAVCEAIDATMAKIAARTLTFEEMEIESRGVTGNGPLRLVRFDGAVIADLDDGSPIVYITKAGRFIVERCGDDSAAVVIYGSLIDLRLGEESVYGDHIELTHVIEAYETMGEPFVVEV